MKWDESRKGKVGESKIGQKKWLPANYMYLSKQGEPTTLTTLVFKSLI